MGEAFGNKRVADGGSTLHDYAKFAAIAIFVAIGGCERKAATAQYLAEALGCMMAKARFSRTRRTAGLGRIDVGDADFLAVEPERIAIDNAGFPRAAAAERQAARGNFGDDFGRRTEKKRGQARIAKACSDPKRDQREREG